jgi:hypothetical protein
MTDDKIKLRKIVEFILKTPYEQPFIRLVARIFPHSGLWTLRDATDDEVTHFLGLFKGVEDSKDVELLYSTVVNNFQPYIDYQRMTEKAMFDMLKHVRGKVLVDYIEIKIVKRDGGVYARRDRG